MNLEPQNWEDVILRLKQKAKEKGITQQEIADKTGMKFQNVNRFFSLRIAPSIKAVCLVASAIGEDI